MSSSHMVEMTTVQMVELITLPENTSVWYQDAWLDWDIARQVRLGSCEAESDLETVQLLLNCIIGSIRGCLDINYYHRNINCLKMGNYHRNY